MSSRVHSREITLSSGNEIDNRSHDSSRLLIVHRGKRLGTLTEVALENFPDATEVSRLARRRHEIAQQFGAANEFSEATTMRWLDRLQKYPSRELLYRLTDINDTELGYIGASVRGGKADLVNLLNPGQDLEENFTYRALFVLVNKLLDTRAVGVIGLNALSDDPKMRLFYRIGFELKRRMLPTPFAAGPVPRGQDRAAARPSYIVQLALSAQRFYGLNDVFLTESRAHADDFVSESLADLPPHHVN